MEATEVLLHPDTPDVTALLMAMGYVRPTGRSVEVAGISIPIYQLTDLALIDPIP